jgi:hypothetical protein
MLADIVDDVEAAVAAEHRLERPPDEVRDALPVRPGEVGGRTHRRQVVPALGRSGGHTGELAVRDRDAVAGHRRPHLAQRIRADLVAKAARARVNQHDDLVDGQSEVPRRRVIRDALDVLDLEEVVAAAQRADLRPPALPGTVGHGVRIRIVDRAASLREVGVAIVAVTAAHHPPRALHEHAVEIVRGDLDEAGASRAARHLAEHLLHQLAQARLDVLPAEAGSQEPDAAVDVEAHASRRHDAAGHVRRRHAADGEPVALVEIRHRQARPDDARQHRHVHGLIERPIPDDVLEDRPAGEHHHAGAHATRRVAGDAPAERVNLLEGVEGVRHGGLGHQEPWVGARPGSEVRRRHAARSPRFRAPATRGLGGAQWFRTGSCSIQTSRNTVACQRPSCTDTSRP